MLRHHTAQSGVGVWRWGGDGKNCDMEGARGSVLRRNPTPFLNTGMTSKHVLPLLLILPPNLIQTQRTEAVIFFLCIALNFFCFSSLPFLRSVSLILVLSLTISPSLYSRVSVCLCMLCPLWFCPCACQCCATLAETMLGIFLSVCIYLLMVMLVRAFLPTFAICFSPPLHLIPSETPPE